VHHDSPKELLPGPDSVDYDEELAAEMKARAERVAWFEKQRN